MAKSTCYKCYSCTLSLLLTIVLLIFTVAFIIIPFVFKYSTGIQKSIAFPTYYILEKDYTDLSQFPIKGVRNYYVTVNKSKNITLGMWHVLPSDLVSNYVKNEDYDYENLLKNSNYSTLLYFHGNGQDRTGSIGSYQILRKFFNIIVCDYRGYADSTDAELTEQGVVDDVVRLYKLIENDTKSRMFLWGHSLGTGVAIQAASVLKKHGSTPSGIVLEAPFTSITDVMADNSILKLYSWMPWFEFTFISPMIENGFNFDSASYISDVDCPIMILHAKDDSIIPYKFATKLYDIANSRRNFTSQGNVTYHLLEAVGYDHEWIYEDPDLPQYIRAFISECDEFERRTKQ